jgi:uncharacterized membrane protein YdjX (TVP38/TMEM64 family)
MALGAALAAGVAYVFVSGSYRMISYEVLLQNYEILARFVADQGFVAILMFGAIYASAVALSVPCALVMTLTAGVLFGTWVGASVALIGSSLGACVLFLIARTTIGRALALRAGPAVARLTSGFRKDAFNYLLMLRLTPIIPFWIVNLAPALIGVRFGTFAAATFIGMTPTTLAIASAAAGLSGVVKAQAAELRTCRESGAANCTANFDPSSLLSTQTALALVFLATLSLVPVLVRRWKARSATRVS